METQDQILLLREENRNLKNELATEKMHYRQLHDKYCELWVANNKRKKPNIIRTVLAAPFMLVAAPFIVVGEGWKTLADWVAGVDK